MSARKFHRVAIALFASVAFVVHARADDLNLGSSYGDTVGVTVSGNLSLDLGYGDTGPHDRGENGGSITPSSLNSVTTAWVYCVDITHNVGVPGDYPATITNTNGIVNAGASGYYSGYIGHDPSGVIADEITYLLLKYGTTPHGLAQDELQAAIWKTEYGNDIAITSVAGDSSAGTLLAVTNLVNEAAANKTLGEHNLVTWLTPAVAGDFNSSGKQVIFNQGLVTNVEGSQSIVPEPSTFAIAGLGALAFLGYGLRRRKSA